MTEPRYRYEIDWEQASRLGQTVLYIAVILLVTWALAKAAKWAFEKLTNAIPLLQRSDGSGKSIGSSLGTIAALLVWLVGLVAVLQQLGFDEALLPVQSLLNQVAMALPKIAVAIGVFALGLVLARIVRQLIETTLAAVNLDRWAAKGGVDNVVATTNISHIIGTIAYAAIVIFFSIIALGILDIPVISEPLSNMLQLIFEAIPRVLGAVLMLGLGYMLARWVSGVLTGLLQGMGFDRSVKGMEIMPENSNPSAIVGNIVMIAILLAIGIAAMRLLGFPELTNILEAVLTIGGNIVFGIAIIAVGFLLANLLSSLVASATGSSELAVNITRWATIGLFVVMGLAQMGIGGAIVETAFVAVAIGIGLAIAIAFGWGGREEAARVLADARAKAKDASNRPAPPPKPKMPRAPRGAATTTTESPVATPAARKPSTKRTPPRRP